MPNTPIDLHEYQHWLTDIKQRVVSARLRVALAANSELIHFYWDLGGQIAKKQAQSQWGDKLINKLSEDLRKAFPGVSGLSVSNLKYCLRFYTFYSNCGASSIGQQPVDQLPWDYNLNRAYMSV